MAKHLATYASPVFGSLPVAAIDTGLVMKALERDALWTTKPETASRVRGRIEMVLDWAMMREFREGDNPARWKGRLEILLPKRSKVRAIKHHTALPYAELPKFMSGPCLAHSDGGQRLKVPHSNSGADQRGAGREMG